MSKNSSRREELETNLKVMQSREQTALNNYQAALSYAKENSAHGKTLEARQNQDKLLKESRKAQRATQLAKTDLEAHDIIDALSKKRKLAKQKELEKQADRETGKTKKTRGFARRGRDKDHER